METKAFYGPVVVATGIGVVLTFTPVNPITALYRSAVINGIVAVPVMAIHDASRVQARRDGPVHGRRLAPVDRLARDRDHGRFRARHGGGIVLIRHAARDSPVTPARTSA
jgi:hypothetical protein